MAFINRQTALISITSGTLSILSYILFKKLFCKRHKKKSCLNDKPKQEQSKIYEDKALLDQYMMFNFCEGKDLLLFNLKDESDVTNCFLFPKRVALLCRDYCPDIFFAENPHPRNALDIGCAVGRSCFELSKLFDQVIGIDYSKSFIDSCKKIMLEKTVDYECKLEGNITQKLTARLENNIDASKISFEVGDACNLREDLGTFNLVLASNLICRLTEPIKFLNRLKKLVKPNGYVILSTPFTWGSEYTPEENWLGGYVDKNGKEIDGLTGLERALKDSFILRHELNMPMLIRETKRKFQYTVCLVTIWQKI